MEDPAWVVAVEEEVEGHHGHHWEEQAWVRHRGRLGEALKRRISAPHLDPGNVNLSRGRTSRVRLTLRNFRGVGNGELDLPRIAILLGPNNSGKTTILEAIYLLQNPLSDTMYGWKTPLEVLKGLRSLSTEHGSAASFFRYYVEREASIEMEGFGELLLRRSNGELIELCYAHPEGAEVSELQAHGCPQGMGHLGSMNEDGKIKSPYHNEKLPIGEPLLFAPGLMDMAVRVVWKRWQELANIMAMSRIAEELSDVLGGAQDLTYEPYYDELTVYAYMSDRRRIRLADMGEGAKAYVLVRALYELLRPKFILWDDAEAHMNPRLAMRVAGWIADLDGVHVVMTTHSLEFASAVAGIAGGEAVLLALVDGELRSKRFSADGLEELGRAGIDVRLAEGFLL